MADAFISHWSADAALAGRIERMLEKHRCRVWLDRPEIRLGQLLRKELQSAIRDGRASCCGRRWPRSPGEWRPKSSPRFTSERCSYESLFVDPRDFTALNGLGSILFYRRDLGAAELFIRRALLLAKKAGVDYGAASHDLQMVRAVNTGA